MPRTPFEVRKPEDIDKFMKLANNKADYRDRLKAIGFLAEFKCEETVSKLYKLMSNDKIFPVKEAAFRALQNFGEDVRLTRKKKGKPVKSINDKLLIVHNSFAGNDYSIKDFKVRFCDKYPEIYDIYTFEKKYKLDAFLLGVINNFPKRKIIHSYIVSIEFENPRVNIEENITMSSGVSDIENDILNIEETKIEITCYRSSKIDLRNIITDEQNTINLQIVKSLIYYYVKTGSYNAIKEISILRCNDKGTMELKIPNSYFELDQILSSGYFLEGIIDFSKIHDIFEYNPKSIALINSLTFLLKSKISVEPSEKFDKLWRAFNSIYNFFGNGANENLCHRLIRKFIIGNASDFSRTIALIKDISANELKDKIRFKDLIINDYPSDAHVVSFIAFIYRYNDRRIQALIKDNLIYQEEYLKDIFSLTKVESKFNQFSDIKDIYQDNKTSSDTNIIYKIILSHLEDKIKDEICVIDIEVVALICIKYAYYLRNKIFHAEKFDLTFRFAKIKFVEDLNWINLILENLIIDLININDTWTQNSI